MDAPPLHPDCAALAPLLGTWRGRGRGDYPTIDAFDYVEEVVFVHVGKPFLAYTQRTRDAATGEALHAESGYLRCLGGSAVEFVVAQPSGIVEIHAGTWDGGRCDLRSVHVASAPAAKACTEVRRRLEVDADRLAYRLDMAAVGQDLQFHLEAVLERAR